MDLLCWSSMPSCLSLRRGFWKHLSGESVICSQADLAGQPVFNELLSTENNLCARMWYFVDSGLGYTMPQAKQSL